MKKQLLAIMPGTPILYRERAAVVLEHTGGGVFVQLIDSIGRRKFGSTNDWRTSELRKYLNSEFASQLCEGNTDELLDTVTDLTAMDGTTDYGHHVDKVTLLTVDQCRKYRYIRPLRYEPTYKEWKLRDNIFLRFFPRSFLTSYKGWKLVIIGILCISFYSFLTSYKGWKLTIGTSYAWSLLYFSNFL